MKRNSITVKLFIITSAFFIILITATLFLQSAFFEKFYEKRKTKTLETNIELFKNSFLNNEQDIQTVTSNMYKFEETNNSKIALWSKDGKVTLMTRSKEEQKDPAKSEVIMNVLNQWENLYSTNPSSAIPLTTRVYNIEHPYYHTQNLVIITPIWNADKLEGLIFVVTPLQPIGEAASVIREYYVYIYIFALVIILIMSLIYSKMIAKPLVKLNKVATGMSELNFSEKCPVSSDDEIGSLANALNFLSEKLEFTLTELQKANTELKDDLEREKKLEGMRKEFIAGVSHELKTPLSLIEGYTEGLQDNIADGENRDFYLEVIIDETQKMNSLVNDMLDLSRLEAENYSLNLEELYIDELVSNVTKKFSHAMKKSALKLNLILEEEPLKVMADPFRIEQVLTNFMSNAIKNADQESIIDVKVSQKDNEALIEVENQGAHIQEEDLKRIWMKFYKVDKSRNRDFGGTGLGLAIVKNILELHKSSFGVENTDIGVKFYFTLKTC